MFNDQSSPLAYLHSRRSAKPRDLVAPGPNAAQLEDILRAAMRVPDHGKLAPWRFIIIDEAHRAPFEQMLRDAYLAEKPDAGRLELESITQFAHQAPTLVAVLSTPIAGSKIPRWEQELSAGAACMNMLHAAIASGYNGGWLTGWAAFSDRVRDALGGGAEDKVAGFLFLGTPSRPLDERPRPEYDVVVSHWGG